MSKSRVEILNSARGWVIGLTLALMCGSPVSLAEKPTPAAKKAEMIQLIDTLEKHPTAPNAKQLRDKVLTWLNEAPDVTITLCDEFLGVENFPEDKPGRELLLQQPFAEAKFILEHPDQAGDDVAVHVAGIEGALRTYAVMKANDANFSIPSMEGLVKLQGEQKLPEYVRQAMAKCDGAAALAEPPSDVLTYPIFKDYFACSQHWVGALKGLGDALGSDCYIMNFVDQKGRLWMRAHRGGGMKNEDWFGWHAEVLSPCTCTVEEVHVNPVNNVPGILGKPPASAIGLVREDGVHFVLAHVEDIRVKVKDQVTAGQVVALVGNNGMARIPHIHIGAWKDKEPLQIRFDLAAMGVLLKGK